MFVPDKEWNSDLLLDSSGNIHESFSVELLAVFIILLHQLGSIHVNIGTLSRQEGM